MLDLVMSGHEITVEGTLRKLESNGEFVYINRKKATQLTGVGEW